MEAVNYNEHKNTEKHQPLHGEPVSSAIFPENQKKKKEKEQTFTDNRK